MHRIGALDGEETGEGRKSPPFNIKMQYPLELTLNVAEGAPVLAANQDPPACVKGSVKRQRLNAKNASGHVQSTFIAEPT